MKRFRSVLSLVFVSLLAVAGPSAMADGTLSFPGQDVFITTGDATTSTFRVFNSSSVELLRVAANGNVGIGTTDPQQKLEIFNGGANHFVVISTPLVGGFAVNQPIGGLRLGWKYSTAAANNVDFQVVRGLSAIDGAGLAISTSPSNTQTIERMRITSGGSVGIGTSAPGALLDLGGTNSTQPRLKLSGSEFYQPANSEPLGGVALVLGVNRLNNRQLWIGDSTRLTPSSSNVVLRLIPATNHGAISALSTDVSTAKPLVLNEDGGNVGIGTVPGAAYKLDVNGATRVSGDLTVTGNFSIPTVGSYSVGGTAPSGYPFYATSSAPGVAAAIQLHSNLDNASTSFIGNLGGYGTYMATNREPQTGAFTDGAVAPNQKNAVHAVVGDSNRGRLFHVGNFEGGTETVRLLVKYNGNVGIGSSSAAIDPQERLVVDGNINVTGNINAKYQDIAEWVPASNDLLPGTVVVLDAALGNGVMASTTAYDTKVAGVVSAQPGIILGESGASKEQVATTGRVRVKVDATRGPIAVGDILVTSDKPGYAMRSVPVDVAGIAFHRPGTIVGKALEPLAAGQGEVLVLLSLQ